MATEPLPHEPLPTVRLSGLGDVAAALPHLIGFRPRESLVVVSLTGPSARVGLTARIDLPPPAFGRPAVEGAVRSVSAAEPAAVLLAVVSEDADVRAPTVRRGRPAGLPAPELPHRDLVREAVLAFSRARLPVRDTILVRAGRWWSYDCPGPCCAPGAGTPLPGGTTELAAASALSGQVLAEDRADLARRIAPVGFLAAAGMAAACESVGSGLLRRAAVEGREALAEESYALVAAAVRELAAPGAPRLTDERVARLVWGLREWQVRDRALQFAGDPAGAAAAQQLWTELTRRAPAPLDAAPATLLAVCAWVRGEGATATVALERALASDPSYTLAGLLLTAFEAGMGPEAVRALVCGTSGGPTSGAPTRGAPTSGPGR
jgi:Domain of unknown function (DUF4192)